MHVTRQRLLTVAAGIGCLVLMFLIGMSVRDVVPALDARTMRAADAVSGTAVEGVATAISGVSTLAGLATLLVAGGLAWRRHGGAAAPTLLRAGLLAVVCCLTILLENVIQRPGPGPVPEWSYPSGHVTIITAVAFTALVTGATLARGARGWLWAVTVTAVTATIASRVLLGEHYLTDTLGALLGTVGVGLVTATVLGLLPVAPARERVPVSS